MGFVKKSKTFHVNTVKDFIISILIMNISYKTSYEGKQILTGLLTKMFVIEILVVANLILLFLLPLIEKHLIL